MEKVCRVVRVLAGLRGKFQGWHRARRLTPSQMSALVFFFLPARWASKRRCVLSIDGVHFAARRRDWVAVDEIVFRREYDLAFGLVDSNEPNVVDLGANIGLFSLRVFSWIRSARFFVAEPSRETAAILRHNVAMNTEMRCQIVEAAIWTEDGTVSIHEDPALSTAAAINQKKNTTTSSSVPCITLKSLLRRFSLSKIDLLKMDIEGAEQAVLYHSRDLLPRIGALIVEIHPPTSTIEAVTALLAGSFPYLYFWGDRLTSSKPLLVATRRPHPNLRPYTA